jgi:hypothetical protein
LREIKIASAAVEFKQGLHLCDLVVLVHDTVFASGK